MMQNRKRMKASLKGSEQKLQVLLNSKEVSLQDKAIHLLAEERFDSGSLIPNLEKREYKDRITIGIETYKQLLDMDKQHETALRNQLFSLITKNLAEAGSCCHTGIIADRG